MIKAKLFITLYLMIICKAWRVIRFQDTFRWYEQRTRRLLCNNIPSSKLPNVASRLQEFTVKVIKNGISERFVDYKMAERADSIADHFITQLLNHPIYSNTNGELNKATIQLSKAIKLSSIDELLAIVDEKKDIKDLIETLERKSEQNRVIYTNITKHHRKLVEIEWDEAVKNDTALEAYATSASAMGDKLWVKESNDWMARFITNFFLHGGASKHYMKISTHLDFKNSKFEKNVMFVPTEASDSNMAYSRKIDVLDVGSCYNPLQRSDYASQMQITALDLYPNDPSVYQADFLNIGVGPKGSEPIFSSLPPSPSPSSSPSPTPSFKQLTQLSAESFDAITMSLVLSYLPSPDLRLQMVRKAHQLLRPPSCDPNTPHLTGILVIIEKESIFSKVKAAQKEAIFNQSTLLHAWKQTFRQEGFELIKYLPLNSGSRRSHAFSLAKSSIPSDDSSSISVVKGMWIKQDFDTNKAQFFAASATPYPLFTSSDRPIKQPIGIVGGGIAGAALALALQKLHLPYVLFERDPSFSFRKQGYALTIQQASQAVNELDLSSDVLQHGATSLGHYSYDANGQSLGAYGVAIGLEKLNKRQEEGNVDGRFYDSKWVDDNQADPRKVLSRHNIHISRQLLRELILSKVDPACVQWGKKFVQFEENGKELEVSFEDSSKVQLCSLVGADGIFSKVRRQIFDICMHRTDRRFDLRYLNLMVVLGIAPIKSSNDGNILCQRQWLDGSTRIFTMPFNKDYSMWQMSFPISEAKALEISSMQAVGERSAETAGQRLKKEALLRCTGWDRRLLDLIEATDESLVSGHPVYDRDFDIVPFMHSNSLVTLIGDAAHPMSPFKGQGANQALLDAVHLSKAFASSEIVRSGRRSLHEALRTFESNMVKRVEGKVMKSREAALYLHSPSALKVANVTRASAAAAVET